MTKDQRMHLQKLSKEVLGVASKWKKALNKGEAIKMKSKNSAAIKQDKKIDKKLSPKELKADIASDRKLLAAKVKKGGK